MKQNNCSAIKTRLFKIVVAALVLFFPVEAAFAAACDLKPSAPAFIRHDLTASAATSVSYCELCGYGYVTVIVSNPYVGNGADATDMINMTVVENLRSSGLTYEPTAPNPVRYSVNGGALQVGGAPSISGASGSILTWTSAQIPPLNLLAPQVNINNFSTIAITFAVKRNAALSQEDLITANRQIQASLNYSTNPACVVNSTVSTGLDTLPLREPIPSLIKRGRNVDANQGSGSYTATVYGNINDDVIWRIQVNNTGLAAMQDMHFDDVMLPGNITVNYACPTEAAASAIAAANGVGPGGSGCVASSNTITDFVVANPFGNPGNDAPDVLDAPASGSAYFYLVGKVTSSCATSKTNTASDLQWGCQVDAPAGGIATTSTGVTPASSTATLSTLVGTPTTGQLAVTRQLRGTNFAQPVGSKGIMRITITNNTGGSIKNIKLRDVLPLEYVMDSTFTPTVAVTGGYGNYSGRTNTITWTNPVAGTVPLTSVNPADPLGNTQPEFTLTSTTVHPNYPDQINMLRRGEVLTINFRVVLIKSSNYDKVANLDVRPEVVADGTDPANQTVTLSNSLYLTYEDFCNPGVTKNAPTYPYVDTFTAFPEDLDIDINGSVFILTNDPLQPLTLPVLLTNNGGHDASNYHVFVSFGATMDVQSAPAGCSIIAHPGSPSQPDPWKAWVLPAPIPATATVYHCDSAAGGFLPAVLAPAGTRTLNFQVIKTSDAARIAIDDLSFRADVVGEITLSNGTPLWFPVPTARSDGQTDRANNYSLDAIRARVIGFNLAKSQVGNCTENNPPPASPDSLVQIGEECTFHIDSGGWFGFQTPGFTYIAVQNITVTDELPNGQGYISSTDPALTSTSQVKGFALTAQTSPPLNPLDEGWIDWTFNTVAPLSNRILQKDEWFRVDVTNRILNDPVNLSAAPNLHAAQSRNVLNSTFEAVFNNASTGLDEIFLLGPMTIGYPLAASRRVDLTVTEPNITVVKTVCNETLYGVGTACTNFVALASDGDTYDNYIYRVTLTNGASASSVARAPAYNISATDILDASDLAYVVPFATDGLDNDGDGLIDAADLDGEGTIIDNVVNNAIPATLTFAHTHSSALLQVNAGASVSFYYRVDPDQQVQPAQQLINSVTMTYDSLADASGAQTVVLSANGEIGGARVYNTTAATATVQMVTPSTQPKKIVLLSQPSHVPSVWPLTQPVSVGEEIKYELHTLLPVANLRNFVITDNLPVGVRCTEAPAVNLSAAPYTDAGFVPGGTITPTCTDTQVRWDFGNQALTNGSGFTLYDFAISFIGRVENTVNTNNANLIRNGGAFTVANAQYTNSSSVVVTLPYANADIQVQEPRITLTKAFSQASTDVADLITVTVTATNNTAGNLATAYNLQVRDDLTLAPHLSYAGNIVGVTGLAPTAVTVGKVTTFSWPAGNAIAFGETRTFSYKVLVDSGAQPLEVLSNNALNPMQAKWDSLPGQTTALNSGSAIGADGSDTGLRNGALPNAGSTLNDYETSTFATLTVPAVTINKTDLSPAVVPAIGTYKNFQIDINLPEGTTQDLVLTDNLAAGSLSYLLSNNATYDITYTFTGIATINGAVPTEAAFGAGNFPADGSTGNAVWNIGTVITSSEDDTTVTAVTPRISIFYSARIDNAAATDAGDTMQNSAVASYRNGASGASASTAASTTTQITVVEPLITLTKTVVDATSAVDLSAVQRYTLTMTAANGVLNSDAFDVAIRETLSAGLTYLPGSATINGVATAPLVVVPGPGPDQVLSWNVANGQDIDIAKNGTVTLVYEANYIAAVNLTSTSLVQWTSLNGADTFERDGSGAAGFGGPAYDDYFTTIAVNTPAFPDTTAVTKTRESDTYGAADANLRIGDVVEYRLRINLPQGDTLSSSVVDILPRGLEFVSVVSVNGDTSAPYSSAAPFAYAPDIAAPVVTGDAATGTSTVTWTLGDISNSVNNSNFDIVYRARVLNAAALAHLNTQSITNSATVYYVKSSTLTPYPSSSAVVTVQQPILAVTKTATPPVARTNTTLQPGDVVQYTVDVTNSGNAPAYDVVLEDVIPVGMRNGASTITMVSATINGASILPFVPGLLTYDTGTNTANWNFAAGAANQYALPAGQVLRVVYSVTLNAGLPPGLSMVNAARVNDYCSFDSDDVPLNGNAAWRKCYGATAVATAPVSVVAAAALLKQNWLLTDTTVAIGQQFTYRITIPATPQSTNLYDVHIRDDLSLATTGVDMSYVSLSQVSGPAWTPAVTVTSSVLDIYGSNAGGLDIPAGQQVVFDVTVVLNDNVVANTNGKTFTNTASYTLDQIDDVVNPVAGSSGTSALRTIVGPVLTLQKSGPATMSIGTPATFTLNIQNSGTSTAYDATITDILPNPATGGMCDTAPTVLSAGIYLSNGTTLVSTLTAGVDYVQSFALATPTATTCTLALVMQSATAAIAPGNRLIITYQASLDADNFAGVALTNLAGATQWFSGDTPANVATGQIHTYNNTITDGTTGTLDFQDALTLTIDTPVLEFRKSVINVTTGQNPGSNAVPGERLRYTITLRNLSTFAVSNFTLTDELDRLNATALFVPGTLTMISVPVGATTTLTSATGGSKGSGLVDVRNLNLTAAGGGGDTLTFVFEANLASVITSGTAVLNQAQLPTITSPPLNSDDPNVNGPDVVLTIGDEDPTRTVITSAPSFQVRKTSLDITGDPLVLLAGERLRYTITVKNIGNENASNVSLRDALPGNTTYVAGSTTLNGAAVADIAGVSPLQTGMLINAPENVTAGVMRADASATTANIATITFEVQINSSVLNGTVISNQGFVNGSGSGSGVFAEKPSDDPATATADDPTLNIVGNYPLLVAHKTVAIQTDNNGNGIVDPLDVLRYTITISNLTAIPATGVNLTDPVPVNTTYLDDSVTLNGTGVGQPDGGVSPLILGIDVNSAASAAGVIAANSSAVVVFDVTVNAGVLTGTIISNQGNVTSTELPGEQTDADGNASNGHQPTTIVVGSAQQILITKQVSVVGGGAAVAGGELEYLVRVTNTGTVAASNIVITDDLSTAPLASQVTYVAGSGTLNGLAAGVSYAASIVTANYAGTYGTLAPGATAQLRFRVTIGAGLAMGTTITNTGQVVWNAPALTATASVSLSVGGVPGTAILNGRIWHDANFDNVADATELNLAGWSVGVYRNNVLLGTATTDTNGLYSVGGLSPTTSLADQYALKFSAPGAVATTAKLGRADSAYTNGMQEIAGINALSGSNIQNLNLPIDPNGVVYNSLLRTPATGAVLTMVQAVGAVALQATCFDDPAQQGQVALASGYYKFDLNFSDPSCPSGGDYLIRVTSPAAFMPGQSVIITPLTDGATAAYSVPTCAADAIPATAAYCEAQTSEFAPGVAVPANTAGTNYYLRVTMNNTVIPGNSQIFNNHIALDPRLDNAVTITKIASLQNVTRGQLIPYTITVNNTLAVTLTNLSIIDTFPPGFKYVAGSGRLDGQPVEPVSTTRTLTWGNLELASNTKRVIQLMLIVGSGVKEGKYINRAQVVSNTTGGDASPPATATVRVIPDPTLDCSDVIGKVFDDANLNGYQDEEEQGLPGVRVVTARGLLVTADKFGRFHITCAVVPDPDRGSNFILKLDDRTLPSGYRLTTENPRVQRATRGKMLKFNFGAAIHKVVKLDMSDGVFEPGSSEMRVQWKQRTQLLLGELKKAASVLRLSYLAETESESLVNDRLKIVKREIAQIWKKQKGKYDLVIETEVFWRTGSPPE
ncbi:MAG: isopeptide-forming domain-containing fimbrial protein [Gallionellaceae bacterium]